MAAYYNEIDPFAAAWLRELIKAGHIADGIVDERSIEDVRPEELREFTQCHFFAGIGVWSYALRRAGWPDDRPIWTGSCPCQPFSSAGKGEGFADERHLWPAFFHLIKECRPAVVAGEQVASKDADPWVDLVQADLEAVGYAFGAVPFPSAGVGAPHIRDRLFWVGHAYDSRLEGHAGHGGAAGWSRQSGPASATGLSVRLADTERERHDRRGVEGAARRQELRGLDAAGCAHAAGRMADSERGNAAVASGQRNGPGEADSSGSASGDCGRGSILAPQQPGPVNGFWRDADWLLCRDGKWRPVEPGTFPLAHGAPARVGRLRGYGNAINAEAARAFIEAVLEAEVFL